MAPADTLFSLQVTGDAPMQALVCFPLEGQAVLPGKAPFTQPWAA